MFDDHSMQYTYVGMHATCLYVINNILDKGQLVIMVPSDYTLVVVTNNNTRGTGAFKNNLPMCIIALFTVPNSL